MKVRDIMTADVRTVRLDDPVELAIMNMKNLDIRTLPVIDKDGNLSGIVGIKEVAAYNWKEKKRETVGEIVGNNTQVKVNVDSISIPSVATISPDDDIGKAVDLMLKRKISSLPVLEDGKIVGIITKYDMIELLASFRQRDMVYMQITGLEQDDRFSLEQMEKEIQTTLQKISKISRPMLFTIHVTKYNQDGNTFKYSLSGLSYHRGKGVGRGRGRLGPHEGHGDAHATLRKDGHRTKRGKDSTLGGRANR